MDIWAALLGLFAASFLAATVIPAQSEAALVGLLVAGYPAALLIFVASLGNTLGAVVNWLMGCGIEKFHEKPWFPLSATQMDKASGIYHRWGKWSLMLSWVPIIGDALTVIAGILREPLWSFLALVAIAKTGRYVVLAFATTGLIFP